MLSKKYQRSHQRNERQNEKQLIKQVEKPMVRESPTPTIIKPIEPIIEKETAPVPQIESLFRPFELNESSSFHPKKLPDTLDIKTRAKYMAYMYPTPEIQAKITQSELRSRQYLRQEHVKMQHILEESRKKWDLLHKAKEDPKKKHLGEQLAELSRKRLLMKQKCIQKAREEDIQYLVEGQSNAIDAIQLKEHLLQRKPKLKPVYQFTHGEKARLEEIMSLEYLY